MNPNGSQGTSNSNGQNLQNPNNIIFNADFSSQSSYLFNTFHTASNNNSTTESGPHKHAVANPFLDSINNSQAVPTVSKKHYPISSSHMIEFTKHKNWSHRIIDQLSDLYYVINPAGRFMYCSPSSLPLVGYSPSDLVGRNIVDFIHVDDVDIFIRCIKQSVDEPQFRLFYRFRKKDDRFIMLEVQGHSYKNGGVEPKCFFSIARPYPLKATSNMDKLLELKLENEVLNQKLQQLRESFDEEPTSPREFTNHEPDGELSEEKFYNENSRTSLDLRGGRLTRGSSSSNSTSNLSTSARNENSVLPPQNSSKTTVVKKKRKHKLEDDIDRVCTECGKTDSPEWRKGPNGPKTLCNACGLRWAKKSRCEAKSEDS